MYSGIFKGTVYIADSGETTKNRLVSNPGDVLYAKYVDFTLPDGSTSEIVSAAVVKISGQNMDVLLNTLDPGLRHMTSDQNEIPAWVKNNAGWWADGTLPDGEFLSGIEFLIKDGIIIVSPTDTSSQTSDGVPAWVKNNAGWWADGTISDGEFVNGIQHLVKSGLVSVSTSTEPEQMTSAKPKNIDSELAELQAELDKCSKIVTAYKRIDCEKPIKKAMTLHNYKINAEKFDVGPITYYWQGVGSEGNEFYTTPTGQAILSIRMLAENTISEITAINCTSPQICAYDAWNGEKAFKYSGMDFTSGQIVMNPGDSREFNILFGPNIGYGGTEFEYYPSKEYFFRINEDFGSVSVPLNLE
ncbi:MAG: peptidase [Nitrosopumilus sp.]|nr:peptidase [Nitrosopumilus sp.]